jgi:predicted Zn-dependent peptidase
MGLSRRDALRGLLAGGVVVGGHGLRPAPASGQDACPQNPSQVRSLTLANGLRAHIVANGSRYVSAALVLRSSEIRAQEGLAHLIEHTSFTGAAGPHTAQEIRDIRQDCLQSSNATTQPGMIVWQASFLPKHLVQALDLLAVASLDQKLDTDTVASEARVVLQELYLDKYHAAFGHRRRMGAALFGRDHPYAADTIQSEIAKARTPPEKLAAELREYARTIRLPANMDLFLVGGLDPESAFTLVETSFGGFPFAQGPMLALPRAPATAAHRALAARSPELRAPLSEIRIAWNTGVGIMHPDAKVVLALSAYLNTILFRQLRERHGDAYSPGALYEPDTCSGVFEISIPSTAAPDRIERSVFEGIAGLKADVDAHDLVRFRDRVELTRRKNAESSDALVDCLMHRQVDGGSVYDLDLETVTREDVLAAARKYLPSYRGAYVRLSLLGR